MSAQPKREKDVHWNVQRETEDRHTDGFTFRRETGDSLTESEIKLPMNFLLFFPLFHMLNFFSFSILNQWWRRKERTECICGEKKSFLLKCNTFGLGEKSSKETGGDLFFFSFVFNVCRPNALCHTHLNQTRSLEYCRHDDYIILLVHSITSITQWLSRCRDRRHRTYTTLWKLNTPYLQVPLLKIYSIPSCSKAQNSYYLFFKYFWHYS